MTIQLADAVAAHVQSRVVDTEIVPDPPDAGTLAADPSTVTAHFAPVGCVSDVEAEPHAAAMDAHTRAEKKAAGRRARTRRPSMRDVSEADEVRSPNTARLAVAAVAHRNGRAAAYGWVA